MSIVNDELSGLLTDDEYCADCKITYTEETKSEVSDEVTTAEDEVTDSNPDADISVLTEQTKKCLKEACPWLYRALRTFIQTFIAVAAGQVATVGLDELDKQMIFSVAVSAGAAAIAAVMNLKGGETNAGE